MPHCDLERPTSGNLLTFTNIGKGLWRRGGDSDLLRNPRMRFEIAVVQLATRLVAISCAAEGASRGTPPGSGRRSSLLRDAKIDTHVVGGAAITE